ncbi:STAS domain-containing protein [Magnetospirillum sp. UT-4]|uniref:STAS domain-containing protein n=1 Tax=Magnetospirillum sp. UT-4 TaxID=2681467 RepID=UPI0013805308|nr:STAS domain-containing protein [Magnetospirillum sp. UT-4]CAA7625909.1 Anti-sigma factor antagonist [Magnetospirillum sp. UT-4]
MELQIDRQGRIAVVTVAGRLSSAVADAFDESLQRALDDGAAEVLVDMSHLTFIASTGLRALILAAKRLNPEGGRVHLFGMDEPVRDVFQVSGLMRVFPVYATRAEAEAALG